MLATISTTRRPTVALRCYADNPPLNYVDPTGTTQAGNPLTNLFAGGYSGGTVASPTFVNPYVGSTSIFATPAIPNFNANLGLSNYNSSPLGPTNFISSLVTPPAPSFVSAFGGGTGIVSNLDAISSSLSTFRYPTHEEYAYAEANPHGPAVKVQTIESTVHGDKFRAGPDTASYLERLNRSLFEKAARKVEYYAREIVATPVDAIFPPSDPSYVVTYRDGTRNLYIGEGPSTGHLAGQAGLIVGAIQPSVSRPAGSLTLRDAPKQGTTVPSTNLSQGAQLRAKLGTTFDEYARFRDQGFTPSQSKYLTKPYTGEGHHFPISQSAARDVGIPKVIADSQFNVLRPSGISQGRFYELHYKVDPNFYAARFPSRIGGTWNGTNIGLQKYGPIGQYWYGTPTPLKIATGAAAVGAGAGSFGVLRNSGN